MIDGNGRRDEPVRGLPPQEITDKHLEQRGLLVDGLVGKLVLRRDLGIRQVGAVDPSVRIDPAKYREACQQAQAGVMQSVGFQLMRLMVGMPQTRLLAVPFPVKSLRHEADIGVQIWDFVPGEGSWMGGLNWVPGDGKVQYASIDTVRTVLDQTIRNRCLEARDSFDASGGEGTNPHALPDIGDLCPSCAFLLGALRVAMERAFTVAPGEPPA